MTLHEDEGSIPSRPGFNSRHLHETYEVRIFEFYTIRKFVVVRTSYVFFNMRISRKKRPQKPLIQHYDVNNRIRATEVRLIDAEGKNVGIVSLHEALRQAAETELDLVEINPKASPPVAQILDFGAFKYQKEKEVKKQKIGSHVSELKGLRLSIRISDHDLGIRRQQAEKFLHRGDKVKMEIILRGRENARPDLAFAVINKLVSLLETTTPLRFEQEPTHQHNKITAIVAKK